MVASFADGYAGGHQPVRGHRQWMAMEQVYHKVMARNSNYFHFQLFPLGVPSNQLFTLVTGAKFKLLSLSIVYLPTKHPIFLFTHQAPDLFLLDLSREAALRRWYSAT